MKLYWRQVSPTQWQLLAEPAAKVLNLIQSDYNFTVACLGMSDCWTGLTLAIAKDAAERWLKNVVLPELERSL